MKTKYSTNGEVLIAGSRKELKTLSEDIYMFLDSKNEITKLTLTTDYDPYEQAIKYLKLSKSSENKIEIEKGILIFTGQKEFFESLAKNLPYDAKETPYHIHYDSISFPQFLTPEAPEIVFEATH